MSGALPASRPSSADGSTTPAVELIDITKTFPGVIANDHISLKAMPGEVLCLLGENGAGKSTLMSILSGLYQPDSGSIEVDGRAVRIDSPRSGRELGIGMVYQHLSLIPTLTRAGEPHAGLQPRACGSMPMRLERAWTSSRAHWVSTSIPTPSRAPWR